MKPNGVVPIAVIVGLVSCIARAQTSATLWTTRSIPAPAICVWRTTVEPGETDYIWSPIEKLASPAYLSSVAGSVRLDTSRRGVVEDSNDAEAVAIPASAAPGPYQFSTAWPITGDVRAQPAYAAVRVISSPAPRPTKRLSPSGGDDSAQIQAAWEAGHDILLSPGTYVIAHSIRQPAGASIAGTDEYSVVVIRRHNANDYRDDIFEGEGGYGGTVSDITFDFTSDPSAQLDHDNVLRTNPNYMRLRMIDGTLPLINATGSLFQDCEFIRCCGMEIQGHTMFLRCSWEGAAMWSADGSGQLGNELIFGGDQDVMIDCKWEDTCRGIVFRNGPTNSYFNSLNFHHLVTGGNANEVLLAEESPTDLGLRNNLFTYIQIYSGRGAAIQLNAPATNNIFRCFDIQDGFGINLVGEVGGQRVPQTGNLFETMELRYVRGIFLGQGVVGNTFREIAIIDPRPSWSNEWWFSLSRFPLTDQVIRGAAGNRFTQDFRVFGMPDGWTTGLEGIAR